MNFYSEVNTYQMLVIIVKLKETSFTFFNEMELV